MFSYGKYCHWPKLCIDDDASVYILVFNLLLSNIHVRQPFPASLAVKKSWKKNQPCMAGFEPGCAFHTAWQTQSLPLDHLDSSIVAAFVF